MVEIAASRSRWRTAEALAVSTDFDSASDFSAALAAIEILLTVLIANNESGGPIQSQAGGFRLVAFSRDASASGSRTSTQRPLISRPAMRCPAATMALMASVNSYSPRGDG